MLVANLNNVTAQYSGQAVLRGVSFEISSGEKLGLIGANGSGKTTLLRILLGHEPPNDGTVTLASGTRVGYIPQYLDGSDDDLVMDWLLAEYTSLTEQLRTAEKNLAESSADDIDSAMNSYQIARDNYDRLDVDGAPDKAAKILDSLGLLDKEELELGSLSGGEKNVLSLARALLNEPDFLVLDEPGNHLDFMGLA